MVLPTAQILALEVFYNATNGANWTNQNFWMNGLDPCFSGAVWEGIICTTKSNSGENNVMALQLSQNNLRGSLPSELSLLKNDDLGVIELNRNYLTGTIPSELGIWGDTVYNLILSKNSIEGTIPSELSELTEMILLQLDGNELTGSIPEELKMLTSILELKLNHNKLTGAIAEDFFQYFSLPNVRVSLQSNNIQGTIVNCAEAYVEADCFGDIECSCCSECHTNTPTIEPTMHPSILSSAPVSSTASGNVSQVLVSYTRIDIDTDHSRSSFTDLIDQLSIESKEMKTKFNDIDKGVHEGVLVDKIESIVRSYHDSCLNNEACHEIDVQVSFTYDSNLVAKDYAELLLEHAVLEYLNDKEIILGGPGTTIVSLTSLLVLAFTGEFNVRFLEGDEITIVMDTTYDFLHERLINIDDNSVLLKNVTFNGCQRMITETFTLSNEDNLTTILNSTLMTIELEVEMYATYIPPPEINFDAVIIDAFDEDMNEYRLTIADKEIPWFESGNAEKMEIKMNAKQNIDRNKYEKGKIRFILVSGGTWTLVYVPFCYWFFLKKRLAVLDAKVNHF